MLFPWRRQDLHWGCSGHVPRSQQDLAARSPLGLTPGGCVAVAPLSFEDRNVMVSHLFLPVASQGCWVISQRALSLRSGAQSQVSPGDGASVDACAGNRTFSQSQGPRGPPGRLRRGGCRSPERSGGAGLPGLPTKHRPGGLDGLSGGWVGTRRWAAWAPPGACRRICSLPLQPLEAVAILGVPWLVDASSLCACLCQRSPCMRTHLCWIRAHPTPGWPHLTSRICQHPVSK